MSDEHRKALIEEYEEAALKLLMDEYAEAEGDRLIREFEEAEKRGEIEEIPESLDKKCRAIIQDSFAKQARKKRIKKSFKVLGKVAVMVFVFLGVAAATVLSVEALRVPVLNYILQHSERYSSITLNEQNETLYTEIENIKERLSYCVPEQYDLVAETISNHNTMELLYQDQDNHEISLLIAFESGQVFIDDENVEMESVTLNGKEAFFVEKGGLQLIWSNAEKNVSYNLFADALDQDAFWEIAYVLAS